jgi:hypothetical protein
VPNSPITPVGSLHKIDFADDPEMLDLTLRNLAAYLARIGFDTSARAVTFAADKVQAPQSESTPIMTSTDHYRNGWNECLDRALLAVEAEQAKYIVARSGQPAAAVRGALEYAMTELRKLRVP